MRNIFGIICVSAIFAVVIINATSIRQTRSEQTCGVANRRFGTIVRGQNFERGRFPWIVALMSLADQPPTFFCGGTIISETFVVSAAHCISQKHSSVEKVPGDVLALFGAHNLSNAYEAGGQRLSPRRIIKHSDWNQMTVAFDADISLLEFEKGNIFFNNFVQPICLWKSKSEPTETTGIVTGWGKSEDWRKNHEEVPKMIKVLIVSNAQCLPQNGDIADRSSERTFCAHSTNGSGVCRGDSGGGLFIVVNEIFYLHGIVSSSSFTALNECDISRNAIYTNVQKYRQWIIKKAGGRLVSSTTSEVAALTQRAVNTSAQPVTFTDRLPTAAPTATTNQRSIITGDVMEISCTFTMAKSRCCGEAKKCVVNQTIHNEAYFIKQLIDNTVKIFQVSNNKEIKFLPRHIGENFPNLDELHAGGCGLTVLLNFYFKDMGNLQYLNLDDNKIATIESNAFKDLINVKNLRLNYNKVETLDEKLFAAMVNLMNVYLENNQIKFLSPTTFKIPGGKLSHVGLRFNVCISKWYDTNYKSNALDLLEPDIRANCAQ